MDNAIVEGVLYARDSVQHWGDGGTGVFFGSEEVQIKTDGGTSRATIDAAGLNIVGNITGSSNISASGTIIANNMSVANKITHVGDTNTWIGFDDGNDTFRAVVAGSEKFNINTSRTRISNNNLEVNGNITASGEILTSSTGSATRPALGFNTTSGFTGIFSANGTNRMDISIGGTSEMVFDSSRARFGQSSAAPVVEYEAQTGGPSFTYEDDPDTGIGRKSENKLSVYAGGEVFTVGGVEGITVVAGGVATTGARGHITASGNITASGTVLGHLVPQVPKVEYYSVTASNLTTNRVVTLPNSLTYKLSTDGYEYLEVFTDGIRLNRTIDYAEVATNQVRYLMSVPSQSIITYKSLRTV